MMNKIFKLMGSTMCSSGENEDQALHSLYYLKTEVQSQESLPTLCVLNETYVWTGHSDATLICVHEKDRNDKLLCELEPQTVVTGPSKGASRAALPSSRQL
jgi:hypothetical protein